VNVLARAVDDVNLFMENLDKTGAFMELRSRQEQTTDSGQIESALEMVYVPGAATDPAAPPAGAATGTSSAAASDDAKPSTPSAAAPAGGRR
jgi:hypothetical protein